MCHSRVINSQINRLHKRALPIDYKDNTSSFGEHLAMSGAVGVHQKIATFLAIEIFRTLNKLSPIMMSDIFKVKNIKHKLRNREILRLCHNQHAMGLTVWT